jgi:hypothetical protein
VTAPAEVVPLEALTRLAHAATQTALQQAGIRVLHIKGPAMAPHLLWPGRGSTDADVLVPYSQAQRCIGVLGRHGWSVEARFENNSAFEHAATLHHELWGYLDLHRTIPGFRIDADHAFEVLWRDHHTSTIAGIPCDVPSEPAQILILLLHAGRSARGGRGARDVEHVWNHADSDTRAGVVAAVTELDAELGFDAAFGRLDRHVGEREYDLWNRLSRGPGGRIGEWRARMRAAPTRRDAMRIGARAVLVNVDHLTAVRGHRPTRLEVVAEFFARPWRGVRELLPTRAPHGEERS